MTKPLPNRDVAARATRKGRARLTSAEQKILGRVPDESLKKVIAELLISTRLNQENFQELEQWFPVQPGDVALRGIGIENQGEADEKHFWLKWLRKGKDQAAATIRAWFDKTSGHHELRLSVQGAGPKSEPENPDYGADIRVFSNDTIDRSGIYVVAGGGARYLLRREAGTPAESDFLQLNSKRQLPSGSITKGGLVTADGVDLPIVLAVGANGTVLVADSTASRGLKWKTPEEAGLKGLEGRWAGGLHYTWLTNTEVSDPGAGKAKRSNTNSALRISETDRDGNSVAAFLATWDDSTTATNRGTIIVRQVGSPTRFRILKVAGAAADEGAWDSIPTELIAEGEALENEKEVVIEWVRTGDQGEKGATGEKGAEGAAGAAGATGRAAGLHYSWLTNTEATEPAAGKLKTTAGKTLLRISETDKDGNGIAALIATWDDSTTTKRGYLAIRQVSNPKRFLIFAITGANVDEGAFDKLAVEVVSEGEAIENEAEVVVDFSRTGDNGEKGATGEKGAEGTAGPPGPFLAKTAGNAGSTTGISQLEPTVITGSVTGKIGAAGKIGGVEVLTGDWFFQFAGAKTDGLWEVTNEGAAGVFWQARRPTGINTAKLVERALIYVKEGTEWGHKTFVCDTTGIVLGTTELTFRQIANRDYGLASALPTTPAPVVGDRCQFYADKANGIIWELLYDGEGTFPWKKVGGPPLLVIEEAERKTKSTAYQTTGAPSVNYPLGGDYYVSWGSYDVRAAIAGDTGFIRVGYHSNGALIKEAIGRLDANGAALFLFKRRHNERTKGQAAQARYKNDSEAAGETVFEGLFIELDPIRVG